jgi:hypothetical protein|tara:strand:- start:604 stop:840 length:237 start_codon:yes stop_codon:yes gene_type:complete
MSAVWGILGILVVAGIIYRNVRKDAQSALQSEIAENTIEHLRKLNEVDNESDTQLKKDVGGMRSNPMAWWLRKNRNGS